MMVSIVVRFVGGFHSFLSVRMKIVVIVAVEENERKIMLVRLDQKENGKGRKKKTGTRMEKRMLRARMRMMVEVVMSVRMSQKGSGKHKKMVEREIKRQCKNRWVVEASLAFVIVMVLEEATVLVVMTGRKEVGVVLGLWVSEVKKHWNAHDK